MPAFNGSPLKNKELMLIYLYLTDAITRAELAGKLGRTRTNTYYYIGRAVGYWLRNGVLRFKKIKSNDELGGIDLNG